MYETTRTPGTTQTLLFSPVRANLTKSFIDQQREKLESEIFSVENTARQELEDTGTITQFTVTKRDRRLVPLQLAMRKIIEGTYGLCPRCGLPIEEDRLLKTPEAEICRDCIQKQNAAAASA